MKIQEQIDKTVAYADELNAAIKVFGPDMYESIMKLHKDGNDMMVLLSARVKLFLAIATAIKASSGSTNFDKDSPKSKALMEALKDSYEQTSELFEIQSDGVKKSFEILMKHFE